MKKTMLLKKNKNLYFHIKKENKQNFHFNVPTNLITSSINNFALLYSN